MHSYTKKEGTCLQKLRKLNQKLSVEGEKTKIEVKEDIINLFVLLLFMFYPFGFLKHLITS